MQSVIGSAFSAKFFLVVFQKYKSFPVAVTVAYGAGKSSLIKSYEKNNKYKFLNISLATFEIKRNQDNQDLEQQVDFEIDEQTDCFETNSFIFVI